MDFATQSECCNCKKGFHTFRRKHRCSKCSKAVCSTCAKVHRNLQGMPPQRICERCLSSRRSSSSSTSSDIERMRAAQVADLERFEALERKRQQDEVLYQKKQREELERHHFGATPAVILTRSVSLDSQSKTREDQLTIRHVAERAGESFKPLPRESIVEQVAEAEECAICLEEMEIGNAIFTTACGHSFHWTCLRNMPDTSNCDKCPACRAVMSEMQLKKQCAHPRVRPQHKFCRDCGAQVKQQTPPPAPTPPQQTRGTPSSSYRAGSQGAIVRCPQCRMQMRVLPHMYNMRVACPAGHQFQVAVSTQTTNRR